jgi:hypothetical protein
MVSLLFIVNLSEANYSLMQFDISYRTYVCFFIYDLSPYKI